MLSERKNLWILYKSLLNSRRVNPYSVNRVAIDDIDMFLSQFDNEVSFLNLRTWFKIVQNPISQGGVELTKEEAIKKYCCDLQWAKDGGYCGAKPTPTSGPNPTPTPGPNPNPAPIQACPSTSTTGEDIVNGASVKKCVKGDIVKKIQENLKKHGLTGYSRSGNPDGVFGSRTDKTVRQFQASKGLSVDGVVGTKTWLELVKDKKPNELDTDMDVLDTGVDDSLGMD